MINLIIWRKNFPKGSSRPYSAFINVSLWSACNIPHYSWSSTYIPFSNILQAIKVLAEQAVIFNLVGNQNNLFLLTNMRYKICLMSILNSDISVPHFLKIYFRIFIIGQIKCKEQFEMIRSLDENDVINIAIGDAIKAVWTDPGKPLPSSLPFSLPLSHVR